VTPLRLLAARLFVAVVAVVILSPSDTAAARPDAPPVVFAAGDWAFPSPATLAQLHRAGLRTWRLTMSWSDVSAKRGTADFSGYDAVMRAAAANRIEMMVTLTGCPAWACPRGGPPKSGAALRDFQAFTRRAVRRYGHRGSLWGGHPKRPVVYWQVFNEVNGADQWPHPSPKGYAKVLRATATTIRRADRRAKVVLAGLGEKMTIWLRRYLPALYRRPGFKRSFDVMAPEGYAVHAHDTARILTKTRAIMRRYHDLGTPMFVTEMSWATGGPRFPFVVSPASQARRLQVSWRELAACRARWKLRRVYWFSYQDVAAPPSRDYWGFHNGLLDVGGRPKPAFAAFKRFLRPARAARAAGRCA
jgi:polysaccharide biosynthesis protein PslG